MTLSDFLELLDWPEDALDDADSTTVGGWTLERFGTFPKPGDSFRYENLTVTVLAMDGRPRRACARAARPARGQGRITRSGQENPACAILHGPDFCFPV